MCGHVPLAANTLICHLMGSLLSVVYAQPQKYCYLRLAMEDSLYVHIFHKFLRRGYRISIISGCIWHLKKKGCDTIEAALRTHLILPRGRSDCSDIKLVLLRREALLVREMADTSLTSLSDDLAETLSQLLY